MTKGLDKQNLLRPSTMPPSADKQTSSHLFAVDDKVVVPEREPALRKVVVPRLVVIGHFRDGGLCYLPWCEEQSKSETRWGNPEAYCDKWRA